MKKKATAFIQWKGSNICIDVQCECGNDNHIDNDFVYFVKCERCQNVYALDSNIRLVKIKESDATPETTHIIYEEKQ